jgi:hypothetical protein
LVERRRQKLKIISQLSVAVENGQNIITSLVKTSIEILDTYEDIENELVAHFQQLLTEPKGNRDESVESVMGSIPSIITT